MAKCVICGTKIKDKQTVCSWTCAESAIKERK